MSQLAPCWWLAHWMKIDVSHDVRIIDCTLSELLMLHWKRERNNRTSFHRMWYISTHLATHFEGGKTRWILNGTMYYIEQRPWTWNSCSISSTHDNFIVVNKDDCISFKVDSMLKLPTIIMRIVTFCSSFSTNPTKQYLRFDFCCLFCQQLTK